MKTSDSASSNNQRSPQKPLVNKTTDPRGAKHAAHDNSKGKESKGKSRTKLDGLLEKAEGMQRGIQTNLNTRRNSGSRRLSRGEVVHKANSKIKSEAESAEAKQPASNRERVKWSDSVPQQSQHKSDNKPRERVTRHEGGQEGRHVRK